MKVSKVFMDTLYCILWSFLKYEFLFFTIDNYQDYGKQNWKNVLQMCVLFLNKLPVK
jgi:hypothetical protein